MDQHDYVSQRNEIVTRYSDKTNFYSGDALSNQFNLVSAGLINFLPHIEVSKHESIFKGILLHQQLSLLEQSAYCVLDYVNYEGLTNEIKSILFNGPAIICTFHTGSYRLVNLFLTQNHVRYSLVIAKKVIEGQGEGFMNVYNQLPGTDIRNGFSMIDAEAPGSGLRMLKELKSGRSLLLYIDGNAGAGKATSQNDNGCVVDFLHQQIFARKGITYLAHAADVPVLPVASYRKSLENIQLRFFDPIFPDKTQEREMFAEIATQRIYDLVSPIISEYPEQWEAWLYLHKVAKIVEFQGISPKAGAGWRNLSFNSGQFGIFMVGDYSFLFKKSTYTSYEIPHTLYQLLASSISQPFRNHEISKSLFDQLYKEGVLICD